MLRHKQAEELKVGIDINSLPLSAQIQVRAKLDEQKREQNQQHGPVEAGEGCCVDQRPSGKDGKPAERSGLC